jgi:hypothetical protein
MLCDTFSEGSINMFSPRTVLPRLRTEDIIVRELEGELLIYDRGTNHALCLSQAARTVVDRCDGRSTVGDVVAELAASESCEAAEVIVLDVLRRLKKEGLIDGPFDEPAPEAMPTRRQVLKAASLIGVSVPLVSMLLVPASVSAQSGCAGAGQPCVQGGTPCCPGLSCINTESGPTGFTCV